MFLQESNTARRIRYIRIQIEFLPFGGRKKKATGVIKCHHPLHLIMEKADI